MLKMSKQSKQTNKVYLTDQDIFETYSNSHQLKKIEFITILRVFSYLLTKTIIDGGKVFSLPLRLGKLGVIKFKNIGKKIIDYNHFNKTGEKILLKNYHSAGYIAKFYWMRDWPAFGIGSNDINNIFGLKLCRDFSRYLAKQIKDNNAINRYYEY